MKNINPLGFFDDQFLMEKLTRLGDPLQKLIQGRSPTLLQTNDVQSPVTDASTHDSQAIEELLTEKDERQPFYADSAYTGEEQEKVYNCLLPWDKYVYL